MDLSGLQSMDILCKSNSIKLKYSNIPIYLGFGLE
jgi:hypothetical protein